MTVSPIADYEPLDLPAAPVRRRHLVAVATSDPSARLRSAAMFADAALRVILEVIDRRRKPEQLRLLLTPGLIDSVAGAARRAPGHSAQLRRMRLQPVDAAETAFEVAATYTRGVRTRALACRVEPTAAGWRIVALHIG